MPTFQEIQEALAKTRQEYGQRLADLPGHEEGLRQEIYGREQILPKLRQQKDAGIMALWEADKRLAERYSQPGGEMFIQDPYKREAVVGGQYGGILEGLNAATRLAESREDVLGDILERGVKIYELGLTAKEKEYQMLQNELQNILKMAEISDRAGGRAKPEDLIPGLSADVMGGMNLKTTIQKYTMQGLDPSTIYSLYNIYTPYGPAKESSAQLAALGIQAPKGMEFPTEDVATRLQTEGARQKYAEHLDFLTTLNQLKSNFEKLGGAQDYLSSLIQPITGPIAGRLLGQKFGKTEEKSLRADLEGFKAKVRKGYYGTVLSEFEIKESKKYLPDPNVQENENYVRLVSQINEKENSLRNFLIAQGASPEEAETTVTLTRTPTVFAGQQIETQTPYLREAEDLMGDY